MGCRKKCSNYCVNDGTKLALIILWVLLTAAVFAERYVAYSYFKASDKVAGADKLKSYHFYTIMGQTLPLARACAAAIKLQCALLLLFVLRNFISWIRGTWVGSVFPVDKAIVFHRYVAWAMGLFSTIHILAHWINYHRVHMVGGAELVLLRQYGVAKPDGDGVLAPPKISTLAYLTIPGGTGHAMVLCMMMMYTSALVIVRSPMFEVFWFCHHLFLPFYILGCVHGAAKLLQPPDFYIWVLGPLVLYLVERLIRLLRSKQSCIILQAVMHPSNVLELRIKKTALNYISGQYLFVACPYIANFEWHPFTISSSPDEDFVSIHIRRAGDWTGSLHDFMNPEKKLGVVQENMVNAPNGKPILLVDGPFGAASEDVPKFEHLHLWAAGIGVTPFASILKSIKYQIETGTAKVKTVEFYWTNRDRTAFEWFLDLLQYLERNCDFLTINLFFTGKAPAQDQQLDSDGRDAMTGLEARTHYGRPDIKAIYQQKAQEYQGCKVGVFFCGPPIVSKSLYSACRKFTDTRTKTKFKYHKENF